MNFSGSLPARTPVSSASMRETSSADSAKSNTSKFSRIRASWTDFGMAENPCSRCQRSTTCAGVFACACAIATTTGCSSGVAAPLVVALALRP